jgi:hypothetical protein
MTVEWTSLVSLAGEGLERSLLEHSVDQRLGRKTMFI